MVFESPVFSCQLFMVAFLFHICIIFLKQYSLRVRSVRIIFKEIYGLETFTLHTVISMELLGGHQFIF